MKKILLAFLVGTATLAATSSCTKEYYEEHYDLVPSITMVYERTANQWVEDDDGRLLIEIPIPELSDYYVNQGIVHVAISFDDEQFYLAAPATFDGISYSYDYTTGSLALYAQDPLFDESVEITPPQNIVIKVSLTEADYVE